MRKAAEKIKPIARRIIDTVFPPRCLSCNILVETQGSFCSECWNHITFIDSPQCNRCGFPFDYDMGKGTLCGNCTTKLPPYKKLRAVMCYDEHSRPPITRFKYSDKTNASDTFAKWMARASQEFIGEVDFIVPVPLHRFKLLSRKYNQAALLAYSIKKTSGIKVIPDGLIRVKYTPPQASLTRKERLRNVRSAFIFNKKYMELFKDKNILLVDDVTTTGATIDACTKALLKGGVKVVYVSTIAKTVRK